MPYPNEHSARLHDPSKFDPASFRRTRDGVLFGRIKLPESISVIWARLKGADEDTPPMAQALRFDASEWTAEEAKAWLEEHRINYIRFEPATEGSTEAGLGDGTDGDEPWLVEGAKWSTAYINDLPDSAFLYIEPGGKKDEEGKTVPRSLRHFPYKDHTGKIDLPHLRNALARIPQSNLPKTVKERLMREARRILERVKEREGKAEMSRNLVIECAATTGTTSRGVPKLDITAYTGGVIRVSGWSAPLVIDLDGLSMPEKVPLLYSHDRAAPIGHGIPYIVGGERLCIAGLLSVPSDMSRTVGEALANDYPWRASVGVIATAWDEYVEGETFKANGREHTAPRGGLIHIKAAELEEVSVVTLAADRATDVRLVAQAVNGKERTMADEKDIKGQDSEATSVQAANTNTNVKVEVNSKEGVDPDRIRAEERERILRIEAACKGFNSPEVKELKEKAIRGEITVEALQAQLLDLVRATRPRVPAVNEAKDNMAPRVLEAAAIMAGGYPDDKLVKDYGEQVLDEARKRFPRSVGLQQMLLEAAWANGWDGRHFNADPVGVLKAAFSTLSLPGILSNVANKMLVDSFEAVEDVWKQIAATRDVKDFKTVTSYRLTGGFEFQEVGPDGELQHATVGEASYTIQAKTYGRMFAITRQDIINDDLGALTQVPRRIGRGAALALNRVFWTTFLNNSSFFTAARGNLLSGGTSALGIDSLTSAEQKFLEQTDEDGHPVAVTPRFLLVPPALKVLAEQLMSSREIRNTTASTKYPTINPHAGKFEAICSSYLSNSAITGNSSTAWYLLADPRDLAVIEVAFLNGQQTPKVEQAEADFNKLGIQFRGYFDFGVALQEYRAGVKAAGA